MNKISLNNLSFTYGRNTSINLEVNGIEYSKYKKLEIVFVIDRSSSVDSGNKIKNLKIAVKNVIGELSKNNNIKIGIVTSDSVKSTELTIKQFGWETLFDVVIGRESSEFTKESGEPTKLALRTLNANPKTTIMIGDAPMDFVSAQRAGIKRTLLVATGQIKITELSKFTSYALNSLKELEIC